MAIHDATVSDLPGIAKVKVDTWRTTYRGILSDETLDKRVKTECNFIVG